MNSARECLEPKMPAQNGGRNIGQAYDSSTITYRILRAFGWGPLNNLGFFRFPAPFSLLNLALNTAMFKVELLLPKSQTRLVRKASELLRIEPGDCVLDIACGRGKGSFTIANMHPESMITAIDLLKESIEVARTLFPSPNLRFQVDNATQLNLTNASYDKAICIEAAFHFPQKEHFLRECHRVLKRGGRLVIVDFMWKSDRHRSLCHGQDLDLVKNTWQWDDFFSLKDYLKSSRAVGFEIEDRLNWTRWVSDPMEDIFKTVSILGNIRLLRRVLVRTNPLLRSVTEQEWLDLRDAARAHNLVSKHIYYIALVLRKR